ncbi:MAG: hypothetical protein WCK01_01110 [Candidatus Uhrbacteria bacterium]
MNYLSRRSVLLSTLAVVALTGAGCFSSEPAQPSKPQEPAKPPAVVTSATSTKPTTTPTVSSTTQVPASVLSVIDETWKKYTAIGATKFYFQYPTKGTYAPTWGVTIVKPGDAKMQGNCYQGEGNVRQEKGDLQVGDTTFCVTRYEDAGAGQRYLTDYYAGGLGGNIVLITFSKHYSATSKFDVGVYNASLDQIVQTYTHD